MSFPLQLQPRARRIDVFERELRRLMRPGNHDHGQLELPRGGNLGICRFAARVLAHYAADAVRAHQRNLVLQAEWSALPDHLNVGRQVRFIRPIDRPHDVDMMRGRAEGADFLTADGQQNSLWLCSDGAGGVIETINANPFVAVARVPRRAHYARDRNVAKSRGLDGIARNTRRERMRRIDDGIDAAVACPARKARSTAETADPRLDGMPLRRRSPASQRQRDGKAGVASKPPHERGRFRCATENEYAHVSR